MTRLLLSIVCLPLLSISLAATAATLQGVGDLAGGVFESSAEAVSRDGTTVVGSSVTASGPIAFRWTDAGGIVALGDLDGGALASVAHGVSGDGAIVVGDAASATGPEAFVWTAAAGVMRAIDTTDDDSFALTISADGNTISGRREVAGGYRATRWNPDGDGYSVILMDDLVGGGEDGTGIDTCPDGSVIVGASTSTNSTSAYREAAYWNLNGEIGLTDFPGGPFSSIARGVSEDGSVVVGYGTTAAGSLAFRWSIPGDVLPIPGFPGGDGQSEAFDVSDDGNVIVGRARTASGWTAFVWDPVNGLRSVDAVLGDAASGWYLEVARGVSGDGNVIVGDGENASGNREGWIAVLNAPEPGVALATLAAFASLVAQRRSRSRCDTVRARAARTVSRGRLHA